MDWVNFQYNSIHMLLWYFVFFPHKQMVGSAGCGKLFNMIDGLNFSIKSMFAGLRKSLGWRRRESSVWRRKPYFLLLLASPFRFKFTHYSTKVTRHHSTVVWRCDTQLLSRAVSAAPCQGHGEMEHELEVLLLLTESGCHHHMRTECCLMLCSWCFLPPILSFSKGLAREGKTQGSWVSLQVWAFLKSGEKNSSALEYYHPVPFSSLGTLAMPPLVYILFQGKERPASVWQIGGHNPCTVSLLTPGLCMDWVDADKLFLCAPTHRLILQTF